MTNTRSDFPTSSTFPTGSNLTPASNPAPASNAGTSRSRCSGNAARGVFSPSAEDYRSRRIAATGQRAGVLVPFDLDQSGPTAAVVPASTRASDRSAKRTAPAAPSTVLRASADRDTATRRPSVDGRIGAPVRSTRASLGGRSVHGAAPAVPAHVDRSKTLGSETRGPQSPSRSVRLDPTAGPARAPRPARPKPGPSSAAVFRRRRLAVAAAVFGVTVLGGVGVANASSSSAPSKASRAAHQFGGPVEVVIAQPGDTLWSLARSRKPHGDVRRLVQQMASVNGSSSLRIGDRVLVPRSER